MSEYDAVQKILDMNNVTDIEEIEYGGECFDDLMDYYADEMPYGVMKARTGMPDEWIYDKLCDLGFDKPDPAVNDDKHQGREEIPMPFPDARDQHLINKNLNKATGGK